MSVFMKEIVDPEWGNYFVLTGAGYGLMVAIMVALLLLGCVLSNPSGKRRSVPGSLFFSHGHGTCDADQYGQSGGYAHGRISDAA